MATTRTTTGGPAAGVAEFFAGRHVLVTGATGFMGKVLLEKLLRCCPDVGRVYVLVRPKKGVSAAERVSAMRRLPLFESLLKRNPRAFDKLHALEGLTTQPGLGLRDDERRLLQDEASVVFHLAASLDWRASLKKAVTENVAGSREVLDFCKGLKNLVSLVFTSTAFCQCGEEVVEERAYPPPFEPNLLLELTERIDEAAMQTLVPSLHGPHPNSYTYTKAVGESLADEYGRVHGLPIVVVRPSIVTPSLREPVEGWADSLNGPIGVLAAAGKGVMRSMMCRDDCHAEIIPVDICINILVASAYDRARQPRRLGRTPFYNATIGELERVTWGEVLELGRRKLNEYPLEWALWYPDGNIRTNWWAHTLIVFFFQMIPAYFIDFLLLLGFQERFMVRVQRKIRSGHDLLAFFTMREWRFDNRVSQELWTRLDAADRETFFMMNVLPVNREAYMGNAIFGARTYCLREPPSSLKFCRRRLRIQYMVHRACIALFYMGFVYLLLSLVSPLFLRKTSLIRS